LAAAGEIPGKDGLCDGGKGDAQGEGLLHRPHPGALAAGLSQDPVHEGRAGLRVRDSQNVGRDLHQIAGQLSQVPAAEVVRDLVRREVEKLLH